MVLFYLISACIGKGELASQRRGEILLQLCVVAVG